MSCSQTKGSIYILTNPSFPEYVKIEYATDVKERLKQLNNSEAVFQKGVDHAVETKK